MRGRLCCFFGCKRRPSPAASESYGGPSAGTCGCTLHRSLRHRAPGAQADPLPWLVRHSLHTGRLRKCALRSSLAYPRLATGPARSTLQSVRVSSCPVACCCLAPAHKMGARKAQSMSYRTVAGCCCLGGCASGQSEENAHHMLGRKPSLYDLQNFYHHWLVPGSRCTGL